MSDRHLITTQQFNKLLQLAVDKYQLDPKKTYVEITWWDDVFKPLCLTDCDWEDSCSILLFGSTPCNSYKHLANDIKFPTGFWIWNDATYADKVLHRPMNVDWLLNSSFMAQFDNVKFLFENSPVNYYVDINPFKTRVYRNREGETILCFYVDDRDSGEWQPFDVLTEKSIKMFDYDKEFDDK